MFEQTFYELTYIEEESYWKKYFYDSKVLPFPGDYVDCSFLCKYVEKSNGCDVFKYEVFSNKAIIKRTLYCITKIFRMILVTLEPLQTLKVPWEKIL